MADISEVINQIRSAVYGEEVRQSLIDGLTTINNEKADQSDISSKVDKEEGKGLSANDYTTAEKNKLSAIEPEANKTVVDSALSSSSENPVQNKVVKAAIDGINPMPSGGTAGQVLTKTANGSEWKSIQHQDVSDKENTSNKVTSLSSSSTDEQYPSAKCVYDSLESKADLDFVSVLGNSGNTAPDTTTSTYIALPENQLFTCYLGGIQTYWIKMTLNKGTAAETPSPKRIAWYSDLPDISNKMSLVHTTSSGGSGESTGQFYAVRVGLSEDDLELFLKIGQNDSKQIAWSSDISGKMDLAPTITSESDLSDIPLKQVFKYGSDYYIKQSNSPQVGAQFKIGNATNIPDVSDKENTSNKVTSLSSSSTDEQYPSAKCVYDLIGNIETALAALL